MAKKVCRCFTKKGRFASKRSGKCVKKVCWPCGKTRKARKARRRGKK